MEHAQRRLITVITETGLERQLTAALESLGVGYTFSDARGRGSHGRRGSQWSHTGNLRLEVLCNAASAEQLVQLLRDRYFDNYAMVLWVQDVEVLRAEKFR